LTCGYGCLACALDTCCLNSPSWLKQAVTRYALGAPKGARTQRAFIIIKQGAVCKQLAGQCSWSGPWLSSLPATNYSDKLQDSG